MTVSQWPDADLWQNWRGFVGGWASKRGNWSIRPPLRALCSAPYWWSWSHVYDWLRSIRKGLDELGFLSISARVRPLTDGVPGRARNGGWPGGLRATGYVEKYPSNEWFSWKMTTRCSIGVFGLGGPAASASGMSHAPRPVTPAIAMHVQALDTPAGYKKNSEGDCAGSKRPRRPPPILPRKAGCAGEAGARTPNSHTPEWAR